MNDTHGQEGKGWYGFDLDGTLAEYNGWEGIDHIGNAVGPMLNLAKKMVADGKTIKIVTARVAPRPGREETKPNPYWDKFRYADPHQGPAKKYPYLMKKQWTARDFVTDWCVSYFGFVPEITHEKDGRMICLYDDRVKQVVPNRGVLVEDQLESVTRTNKNNYDVYVQLERDYMRVQAKLQSRWNGFSAGMMLGSLVAVAIFIGVEWCSYRNRTPLEKSLDNLRQATIEVQEALK